MLTDKALRALRPRKRLYRVADRGGLCIEVTPAGRKLWRFRYCFGQDERMISLKASYPDTSLAEARELRDAQHRILRSGVDPALHRKREQLLQEVSKAKTFELVGREWLKKMASQWMPDQLEKVTHWLEQHVFPWIGASPVDDILAPEILAVLQRLVKRGTINTAGRVRQTIGQVFRYAIATGRAKYDPSEALVDALPKVQGKHYAALTEPSEIGELLRAIEGYQGTVVVQTALQLAPMLFSRPGELRGMRWSEIDPETWIWKIPPMRRKLRRAAKENTRTPSHLVPLPRQAIKLLTDLHRLTGRGELVFPGVRDRRRPMSENTVNAALRRLGYSKEEMTGHGFRHMASTRLNELGWNPDAIERQLSHKDPNEIRGTYNLAKYLDERRRMMQAWADYLDELRLDRSVDRPRKPLARDSSGAGGPHLEAAGWTPKPQVGASA